MWYLVYSEINTMEAGTFRNGLEDIKVALESSNEKDATAEAAIKWEKILKEANDRWEEQKRTYMHPYSTAFNGANPNPRVIYESSKGLRPL